MRIQIEDIQKDMIIDEDVYSNQGNLIVGRGFSVSNAMILKNLLRQHRVDKVKVLTLSEEVAPPSPASAKAAGTAPASPDSPDSQPKGEPKTRTVPRRARPCKARDRGAKNPPRAAGEAEGYSKRKSSFFRPGNPGKMSCRQPEKTQPCALPRAHRSRFSVHNASERST